MAGGLDSLVWVPQRASSLTDKYRYHQTMAEPYRMKSVVPTGAQTKLMNDLARIFASPSDQLKVCEKPQKNGGYGRYSCSQGEVAKVTPERTI